MEEIVSAIGLNNITTQHSRMEDIKNRKFDYVVSRAVAPLKDLWKWSKPLIKKKAIGGDKIPTGLICLKGGELEKESGPYKNRMFVTELSDYFKEEYFKTKKVVFVAL